MTSNGTAVVCACNDADASYTIPAYVIVFPQLAIAIMGWFRTLLSLNRLTWNPSRVEVAGFVLLLGSAMLRCIGAFATRTSGMLLQFLAACIASVMVWTSFIIIFNNNFVLPSTQQWQSLVIVLVVSLLWEVHSRIMVSMIV